MRRDIIVSLPLCPNKGNWTNHSRHVYHQAFPTDSILTTTYVAALYDFPSMSLATLPNNHE